MSNWDDIPDSLLPDGNQLPILNAIVDEVREAVRIRRDLHYALILFRRERTLPQSLESDIGKRTNSQNPKDYIKAHQDIEKDVKLKINMIANDELKKFLLQNIKRLLPDVSGEMGPRALHRLRGTTTVLTELVPNREDMLIRLLLVGARIKVKGEVGTRANPFADQNGVYYF